MDKYKNKYRIPPARAQWWDYGLDAAYFLTICTWHRKCFFGEIEDEKMALSTTGKIADSCWQEITGHAKNIKLGPYIVMPNHVHGILILQGQTPPDHDQRQKKQLVKCDSKILVKIRYQRSSVDINPQYPQRCIVYRLILDGNHVFTITSFEMKTNTNASQNTF